MPDSRRREAERSLQLPFSKSSLFSGLLVAGLVIGMQRQLGRLPDRMAQSDAVGSVTFTPVALDGTQIAGAWRVTSGERRLGGLSALAVDGDELVALSDSGVAIRLPKPGGARSTALIHDLPEGPGDPRRKSGRDSEALARLADGDWLVAFENRNQVWRYDRDFRSGRRVVRFTRQGWPANRGIEAMAVDREGQLLVIPEGRGTLIAIGEVSRGATAGQRRLDGQRRDPAAGRAPAGLASANHACWISQCDRGIAADPWRMAGRGPRAPAARCAGQCRRAGRRAIGGRRGALVDRDRQ